jgi:hypothetical protein
MSINGTLPKQRLTEKEKSKNDYQWAKDTMEAILEESYPMYGELYYDNYSQNKKRGHYERYRRILSNYQLYNNELNQEEFKKECDRFGIVSPDLLDEIKPYNKTYNKIHVLLREELKGPFDFRTAVIDEQGVRTKLMEYDLQLEDFANGLMSKIMKIIQNYVRKNNAQREPATEEEQQQMEEQMNAEIDRLIDEHLSEENLEHLKSTNYVIAREQLANKILKYLFHSLDIIRKKNDNFKHGLIAGEEITWVGIKNGNPVIEEVNPLGFFKSKSGNTKYYENGLYAGRGTIMASNDIFNNLNDILTDDLVEYIEAECAGSGGNYGDMMRRKTMIHESKTPWDNFYQHRDFIGQHGENYADAIDEFEVYHAEWRSFRKVYFLNFMNEYGDMQMDIVDHASFKIPEYATSQTKYMPGGKRVKVYSFDQVEAEEAWIPDIWTGYKIGDQYAGITRKPYQFRSIDDPFNVKLGYHGISYSDMNSENISLMDRMRPFQFLYFIIAHRLKQFIAEDRAPLVHFDITMVDPKLGLEKTLYYMDQLNIAFFNPLHNAEQAGAYQRGHITSATDRSTMQHINNYIGLLDAIDKEIADVAGVSKQREGVSQAYETATANQQSIVQSSHVTEVYFYTHAKHWENVLNSLVQVAQNC